MLNFIYPVAMEDGMRFAIREGGRTVGAGVVTKVRWIIYKRYKTGLGLRFISDRGLFFLTYLFLINGVYVSCKKGSDSKIKN